LAFIVLAVWSARKHDIGSHKRYMASTALLALEPALERLLKTLFPAMITSFDQALYAALLSMEVIIAGLIVLEWRIGSLSCASGSGKVFSVDFRLDCWKRNGGRDRAETPWRRRIQPAQWAGGGAGEGWQSDGWTHTGHPDDGIRWGPTSLTTWAPGTRARVERGRWAGRATAGPDTREWRGWPRADGLRRGSASARRSQDTQGRPRRTLDGADRSRCSGGVGGRRRRPLIAAALRGPGGWRRLPLPRPGRPGQSPRPVRIGSARAARLWPGETPPGRLDRASRRRGPARRGSGLGARGGPG
jgi:hypothetical protein